MSELPIANTSSQLHKTVELKTVGSSILCCLEQQTGLVLAVICVTQPLILFPLL